MFKKRYFLFSFMMLPLVIICMQQEDKKQANEALLEAARSNNVVGVMNAVKTGAYINAQDRDGKTALMLAVEKGLGNAEALSLSLSFGPIAQLLGVGEKAASEAVKFSEVVGASLAIIKVLLTNGADVNVKDNNGTTALMLACKKEANLALVRLLLKKGADVNLQDKEGKTALMLVTDETVDQTISGLLFGKRKDLKQYFADKAVIINLLLKKGSDVNARDNNGVTVLMRACRNADLTLVRLLLKKGADVNAQDKEDKTAFMLVFEKYFNSFTHSEFQINMQLPMFKQMIANQKAIIDLLLKKGAKVSDDTSKLLSMIEEGAKFHDFVSEVFPVLAWSR